MISQLKPALLALVLTSGLTACGKSETPPAERAKADVPAQAPIVALGQTGGTDGIELTITDVTTPIQVGTTLHGSKAASGEIFVVIGYTMKNVGTKPLSYMNRPDLILVDAKENSFAQDDSANVWARFGGEGPSVDATDLNPNVSAKDIRVWKVDKTAFDQATWKVRLDTPSQALFALK